MCCQLHALQHVYIAYRPAHAHGLCWEIPLTVFVAVVLQPCSASDNVQQQPLQCTELAATSQLQHTHTLLNTHAGQC
jgi:hypothetical protein